MKLLTKEILDKLPKLYKKEGDPNAEIIVKFFTPWTSWTWYAVEGEPTGEMFLDPWAKKMMPDYRFFGMIHGHERELGYFHLSELMAIRGKPFGLLVERDMHFGTHTLAETKEKTI